MKISKMNTGQAIDTLALLTPAVNEILTDVELMAEIKSAAGFKQEDCPTMAEMMRYGAEKINKIVFILLVKKKQCVMTILAAVTGKSPEQTAKQNIMQTLADVKEITEDKELLDFFKSCVNTAETTAESE